MFGSSRALLFVAVAVLSLPLIVYGADYEHAAPVRLSSIYLTPDASSAKLGEADAGHELVVLETSPNWLHVEVKLSEEKVITGWVPDKAIVRASTPQGDQILFGEAADAEEQASQRHGRRGAAQDALFLYYSVYQVFPNSPLAGQGAYRAADIRWQLEKVDVMSRPSAKEQEAYLREGMNEQYMKEVMKKFPGTKWADLAAFHLIDNKLCGEWLAASKCPSKEAEIYEKYANDRPQSPAAPEALYRAAWRQSALIEIYRTETQPKKSAEAKSRAVADAQKIVTQYPQSDWVPRARDLLFLIQQGIPTYGLGDTGSPTGSGGPNSP
jgi:hypothetical protein